MTLTVACMLLHYYMLQPSVVRVSSTTSCVLLSCQQVPIVAQCCQCLQYSFLCVAELPLQQLPVIAQCCQCLHYPSCVLLSCQKLPVVAQGCQCLQHSLLSVAELPAVACCSPVSPATLLTVVWRRSATPGYPHGVLLSCQHLPVVAQYLQYPLLCVAELPAVACCSPVLPVSPALPPVCC